MVVFFILEMKSFYQSKRWKKKREQVLRAHDYLCQESLRYGRRIEATDIHHIFPIEFYPELKWCTWNLVPLCKDMHNKMHDRDSHHLTREGQRLMDRHMDEYIDWCIHHDRDPHFHIVPPDFE